MDEVLYKQELWEEFGKDASDALDPLSTPAEAIDVTYFATLG